MKATNFIVFLFAILFFLIAIQNSYSSERLSALDQDYLEALFLGSGPLVPTYGKDRKPYSGCEGTNLVKWKDGSHIKILYSVSSMGRDHLEPLQSAARFVEVVSLGKLSAEVVVRKEATLDVHEGEIAVYAVEDPKIPDPQTGEKCAYDQGCAIALWGDLDCNSNLVGGKFIAGSKVKRIPPQTIHDVIGHLIFGLCHVAGPPMKKGIIPWGLMGAGEEFYSGDMPPGLMLYEIQLIQKVYGSGLGIGATRGDFVAAGLLNGNRP